MPSGGTLINFALPFSEISPINHLKPSLCAAALFLFFCVALLHKSFPGPSSAPSSCPPGLLGAHRGPKVEAPQRSSVDCNSQASDGKCPIAVVQKRIDGDMTGRTDMRVCTDLCDEAAIWTLIAPSSIKGDVCCMKAISFYIGSGVCICIIINKCTYIYVP